MGRKSHQRPDLRRLKPLDAGGPPPARVSSSLTRFISVGALGFWYPITIGRPRVNMTVCRWIGEPTHIETPLLKGVFMLKEMKIENLTVFPQADLCFSPQLNVFVGENGSGKSHLLKLAYAIISAHIQGHHAPEIPTKALLQKAIAEKLISVFRPEALGRLARRGQGLKRCNLECSFENPDLNCVFDFSTKSKTEVNISESAKVWQEKMPVFLPTRELLTLYPGFVPLYDQRHLQFPETFRDT